MSYIDVLNDAAARADAASTKAEGASQLLEDIANGPVETYVPTLNGPVPTAATAIEELRTVIMGGATAPIIEAVTLTSTGQTNITFNNIQTSGLAVYIDEGDGAYRYFDFTVDGTTSIVLGDSFQAGTIVWGTSQEIGGDVQTAVQQTQANAQLAEDWAILTGQTVDGAEYSSKKYAQDSSASASAAATSESNASASESAAATSASNAATSESNASLSETNAAASESAAALSETNAATSASEASSSASAAATSEANAATSASAAEASATTATNMADSVAVATETYSSTAEGIASTVDGDYFRVASPGARRVEVWKNVTGIAEFIVEYYTTAGVDEQDSKVVKLNRSLQRSGDNGQTLHADFAYDAYGLGTRMSGGVDKAISGEDLDVVERATPKWVWQPSGPNGEMRLTEVPVDTLARDFDPVTGEPKGLLIESAATNDFPSGMFVNNEPDDPALIATVEDEKLPGVQVTRIEGAYDDFEGPRDYRTSSSVTNSASEAGPRRLVVLVKPTGSVRYMKVSTASHTHAADHVFRSSVDLWELQTNRESSQYYDHYLQDVGDGWVLVSFTAAEALSPSYRRLSVAFGMDGQGATDYANWTPIPEGEEVLLALPQHYANTTKHIKTFIPTSDGPVTRAADYAEFPLGDWFNKDEFTMVVWGRADIPEMSEGSIGATGNYGNLLNIRGDGRMGSSISIANSSVGLGNNRANLWLPDTSERLASLPDDSYRPNNKLNKMAASVSTVTGEYVFSANGLVTSGQDDRLIGIDPHTVNLNGFHDTAYSSPLDGGRTIDKIMFLGRMLSESELQSWTMITEDDDDE